VKEQANAKKKFVLPWIIKILDYGPKYMKNQDVYRKKISLNSLSKFIAQGNVFFLFCSAYVTNKETCVFQKLFRV
jgi:hypothetical protein